MPSSLCHLASATCSRASPNGVSKQTAWLSMSVGSPLTVHGNEQVTDIPGKTVWTAFCAEGLGANVQHYQKGGLSPKVCAEWSLPPNWDLKAQMAFGTPTGPPRGGFEKQFAPIEPRVRVFGKS